MLRLERGFGRKEAGLSVVLRNSAGESEVVTREEGSGCQVELCVACRMVGYGAAPVSVTRSNLNCENIYLKSNLLGRELSVCVYIASSRGIVHVDPNIRLYPSIKNAMLHSHPQANNHSALRSMLYHTTDIASIFTYNAARHSATAPLKTHPAYYILNF